MGLSLQRVAAIVCSGVRLKCPSRAQSLDECRQLASRLHNRAVDKSPPRLAWCQSEDRPSELERAGKAARAGQEAGKRASAAQSTGRNQQEAQV